MPSMVNILLLSAALAVTMAAPASPGDSDPCSLLASANSTQITYQQVADCYRSVDFNPKQSKDTIEIVTTYYRDAFVFRDVALTPNLKSPFTTAPVDAMASLKDIGQKRYKNDFDFHRDLALFALSFNDAHVTYAGKSPPLFFSEAYFLFGLKILAINTFTPMGKTMLAQCYSSYIFLQPLQLYAPVINGSQVNP